MAEFKRENISIILKRAANTTTDYVKNKILIYGEPLYLKDQGIIVIGDGVLTKTNPDDESTWTIEGSTVSELISAHKFIPAAIAPTLYKSTAGTRPSLDDTPNLGDNTNNIATTSFVQAAISNQYEVFVQSDTPALASTQKYPVLWIDTSSNKHVLKVKSSSSGVWLSLYDSVILTGEPKLESTPTEGDNSNLVADTAFVNQAIENALEVYYGIDDPTTVEFSGDNQKYPLLYVYYDDAHGYNTPYIIYYENSTRKCINLYEKAYLSGQSQAATQTTTDTTTCIATDQFVWNVIDTLDVNTITISKGQKINNIGEVDGKIQVTTAALTVDWTDVDGDKPTGESITPPAKNSGEEGSCGTKLTYSRSDHVHPVDDSRAPVNNATLTGTVKAPDVAGGITYSRVVTENNLQSINNAITELNKSIAAVSTKKKNTSNIIYVTGINVTSTTETYNTNQLYWCGTNGSITEETQNPNGVRIDCSTGVLMGAAWNDFAEYRKCQGTPGTVVCETGKGDLQPSGERLQPGASVISDTYGMVIGEEKEGNLPVAVAGRVLALYAGDSREFRAGMPVCAGPFGRIYPMTREEIKEYPEAIVGYVSEIPEYEEWNGIKVNNRIWIKVK